MTEQHIHDINDATQRCHARAVVIFVTVNVIVLEYAGDNLS